jgi:hypothetical protein
MKEESKRKRGVSIFIGSWWSKKTKDRNDLYRKNKRGLGGWGIIKKLFIRIVLSKILY